MVVGDGGEPRGVSSLVMKSWGCVVGSGKGADEQIRRGSGGFQGVGSVFWGDPAAVSVFLEIRVIFRRYWPGVFSVQPTKKPGKIIFPAPHRAFLGRSGSECAEVCRSLRQDCGRRVLTASWGPTGQSAYMRLVHSALAALPSSAATLLRAFGGRGLVLAGVGRSVWGMLGARRGGRLNFGLLRHG